MKTKSQFLVPVLVLLSLFAPGLLLPKIGLATLQAQDCAGVASDPSNQPQNYWVPSDDPLAALYPYLGQEDFGSYNDSTTVTGGGGGGGGGGPIYLPTAGGGASSTVEVVTGSFMYSKTDLQVARGTGLPPLAVVRQYVSSMNYNGPIGYNWDFNYNRSLNLQGGAAYYSTGRGYTIQLNYVSGSDGTEATSVGPIYLTMAFFSNSTEFSALVPLFMTNTGPWVLLPTNGYVVSDTHGHHDVFDINGYLLYSVDRHGNTLEYLRDDDNRLIGVSDPATSAYITFDLDDNGRITSATDSAGRTVSYAYDTNYDLYKVTFPATSAFPSGTTNNYAYDYDFRLTGVIDALSNTTISNTYGTVDTSTEFALVSQAMKGGTSDFTYTSTNEVTCSDSKGFVTDYYNDGNGNITSKVVHTAGLHSGEPSTYTTSYTYNANSQPTLETDPRLNTTAWSYDGNGNVLTVTRTAPSGFSVNGSMGTQSLSTSNTYTYESRFNQVATATDANGNVTTFNYGTSGSDPAGNLLSVTNATTTAGTAQESFTYNYNGQIATSTDAKGVVTQYTYGSNSVSTIGNEVSGSGAYGVTTDTGLSPSFLTEVIKDYGSGKLNATSYIDYDAYGNVAGVKDPDGNVTLTTGNEVNQTTEIDGPSGEVEQFTYDANGQVLTDEKQAPDSAWQETANVYNDYEQLSESKAYTDSSDELTTSYTYDTNGNLTEVTDPLSHSVTSAYDERNFLYQTTDATSKTVTYNFDPNGNVTTQTDELSHVTTYAYDGLDRVEKKTFADSSYQEWVYDAEGNVTSARTAAGNTLTMTYNALNQLVTKDYGPTISLAYYISGRLHTATEGGTSLTYHYDNLGRETSFTDQAGRTSNYTYDLDGNRLTSTYPTSVEVKSTYDASGRVTALLDSSNDIITSNTYDSLDRPTHAALGNGTTITASYDLLNRVTSVVNALGDSVNRNYGYIYDNASRATSITDPRGTVGYGYTNRDELNSVTEPGGSPFADQAFVFDAAYNRSTWSLGSTTNSYTANNLDQYTAVNSATPTYNGDGGLATFGGKTYTYDALGKLTEVAYSSGSTLFKYDPFGRRIAKIDKNSGGSVIATYCYHYDGGAVAVEYRPEDTWTYYQGVARTDGTNNQYYYHDAQGNVSAVADNSGNVLEAYEYTAQGHVQITNASDTVLTATAIGNDILYTGQRYDSETGNYYNNARYYNIALGRFLNRDPLPGAEFSQGTNMYAYCGNDCVNGIDPSGMDWVSAPANLGGGYQGGLIKVWVNTPSAKVSTNGLSLLTPGAQQAISAALKQSGGDIGGAWSNVLQERVGNEQNKDLRDADHFLNAAYVSNTFGLFGYLGMGVDIPIWSGLKAVEQFFDQLPADTTPPDMEEIEAGYAGNQWGMYYNK